MQKRILGPGLEVSAIGMGCMGFTHAYGPAMDDAEATRALAQAVDLGYTFFDTAECYLGARADGSYANNEELLGSALKPYRSQIKLASKYGVQHVGHSLLTDCRPQTIRQAIEGSLRRLQTDYLDLYYQHRIDDKVEPETVASVMADLIKEGKILHWGISEANEAYLRRTHAICPVTCVQNRFSMMARWHEKLFPVLEELNVGFVAFSPLANGFLSDAFAQGEKFANEDYRNMMPQYQAESYAANQDLLALIRQLAKEKQSTPAQIALAWLLGKKPYIVPIPGSRKTKRIQENASAADLELSAAEIIAIDNALANIKMSDVFGGSPIKN